jgi:hypothetical protein
MKNGHERAVYALHVFFALLTVVLVAVDLVKVEAVLTNGKMLPPNVTATAIEPCSSCCCPGTSHH